MKNNLPSKFKTWVEFWDETTRAGLHKTHVTVKMIEAPKPSVSVTELTPFQEPQDLPKETEYFIADIKEAAFEELLQDRFEREEVIYWTREVEYRLRHDCGMQERNTLLENLGRVKRILLTQSFRK